MMNVRICGLCRGAKWVTIDDGQPFHGDLSRADDARPCPQCNDSGRPWAYRETCVDCTSEEEYVAKYPDDNEVILAQMEASLGDLFAGVEETVLDPHTLTKLELMQHKVRLEGALAELGEIAGQRTPAGAAIHSELAAIIVECRNRKMM
jgi:hypothetical protein